ncbi:MAG: hypothetical protein RL367_1857, partial [Pseudomonadota bacterium]
MKTIICLWALGLGGTGSIAQAEIQSSGDSGFAL